MNSQEFVVRIQEAWDKRINENLARVYTDQLGVFSDSELEKIFKHVVEHSKYFPKVADCFGAAAELNLGKFASQAGKKEIAHEWNPTGCSDCGGYGMVVVVLDPESGNDPGRRPFEVVGVYPANRIQPKGYMGHGYYESIGKCSCAAGQHPALPSAVPVWVRGHSGYQAA